MYKEVLLSEDIFQMLKEEETVTKILLKKIQDRKGNTNSKKKFRNSKGTGEIKIK